MRRREAYTGGVAYWESGKMNFRIIPFTYPIITPPAFWPPYTETYRRKGYLSSGVDRSPCFPLLSVMCWELSQHPWKSGKIVIAQCMDRCGRPRKLFRGRRSTTSREEVIMPLLSWSVVLFAPYDIFVLRIFLITLSLEFWERGVDIGHLSSDLKSSPKFK